LLNDRHDYSWSLLRWDYWVWHDNMNIFHLKLEEVIHLWAINGAVVAMLNPDRLNFRFILPCTQSCF